MKKLLCLVATVFISLIAFCQTPAGSFTSLAKGDANIAQADFEKNFARISMENYRLRDKRTTLTFDNGFEVTMYSANEAQSKGLISNASAYQEDFTPKFKMPVFHMTPDGRISAAYQVVDSKFSNKQH